jgi:hypothetical protein
MIGFYFHSKQFFWCNFFAKKRVQITGYKIIEFFFINSTMIMIMGYKVTIKANIIDI